MRCSRCNKETDIITNYNICLIAFLNNIKKEGLEDSINISLCNECSNILNKVLRKYESK
jgi:hypothetical protein